MYKIAASVAQ